MDKYDFIVMDDLGQAKSEDDASDEVRRWWDEVIASRGKDSANPIFIFDSRLHEEDLPGILTDIDEQKAE